MYKFIDVNEVSESAVLPSEALQINGEYIENLIPGYRTLGVSGREALSPEIETFETGARDGATMKNKRFPARIIIVKYQLIAKSNEAFRTAYNTLAGVLNVVDAELIFNDETDKYFTGTPSTIGEVEPGTNAVIGEFEILCTDPFKYSVQEHEAEPTLEDGTFVIDYHGTYKSFPTLETQFYKESEASADGETVTTLTGNGDCGYVAFFNESEKIIQIGDPEEVDGVDDRPKSQTLVNQNFDSASGWGSAAKKLWSVNNGVTSSYAVEQKGSPGIGKASDIQYFLVASDWGSGENWHGPSITRAIPADASGNAGAVNFNLSYCQKMCIGSGSKDINQYGAFQVMLTDANGKIVCGVSVYKGSAGKNAKMRFYMNNGVADTVDIDLSYHNKYFGATLFPGEAAAKGLKPITPVKTSTITKSGQTVTFNIGGLKKVFRNSEIAESVVTKITFTFSKFANKTPLHFNGLYWAKFVKNNCDTWRNVPNKFSAGDLLIADCRNGEIFLNDAPSPELGALGNDWETFCLLPGVNQIGVAYSDWLSGVYVPDFKLKYREVFL